MIGGYCLLTVVQVQKSAVLQLTLDKLKNVDDENDVLREENAALKDAHGSVRKLSAVTLAC